MNAKVILASGSAIRAKILSGAQIPFEVIKPGVDEDEIKSTFAGDDLEELAIKLAEAKCMAIACNTDAIVIGSDQIMEFGGEPFDKPKNLDEAAERLRLLAGQTHSLINAVVIARHGRVISRHVDRPHLVMRDLTDQEIELYIKKAGPDILSSVGAYQVENLGARLFERIDGDYFAVLGMSLFPVLNILRREGALAF